MLRHDLQSFASSNLQCPAVMTSLVAHVTLRRSHAWIRSSGWDGKVPRGRKLQHARNVLSRSQSELQTELHSGRRDLAQRRAKT